MNCNAITIIQNHRGCFLREGRAGVTNFSAIVLHQIDMDGENYLNQAGSSYPYIGYPTAFPKSVNYLILANGGIVEMVHPDNTAIGFDKWENPTWPYLQPNQDPNSQFLHIGWIGTLNAGQFESLTKLLCCIYGTIDFLLPLNDERIIVARDIDETRDNLFTIPLDIIPAVETCVENNGFYIPPTIQSLEDRIKVLEDALFALQLQVINNTDRLDLLETRVDDHEARITSLEEWRLLAEPQITQNTNDIQQLLQQITALTVLITNLQGCVEQICPDTNDNVEIHYQTTPNTSQNVTAGVNYRANFPIRIQDTTPPTVLPGPLWSANLSVAGTYLVTVDIRMSYAEWCANSTARLYLNYCNELFLLDTFTTPTSTGQSVTLSGTLVLTVPPECALFALVYQDDVTNGTKVIEYGNIRITAN